MFWKVAVMPKDKMHQASTLYYNWRNIFMSWQTLYESQIQLKKLCIDKSVKRNFHPYFLTEYLIPYSPSKRTNIANEKLMQWPNGDQEVLKKWCLWIRCFHSKIKRPRHANYIWYQHHHFSFLNKLTLKL